MCQILKGSSERPNTVADGFCGGHASDIIISELRKIWLGKGVCATTYCSFISDSCHSAFHPVYDSNLSYLSKVLNVYFFLLTDHLHLTLPKCIQTRFCLDRELNSLKSVFQKAMKY